MLVQKDNARKFQFLLQTFELLHEILFYLILPFIVVPYESALKLFLKNKMMKIVVSLS